LQLQGSLCDAPNTCQPVNYFAMPLGAYFNNEGAKKLTSAINGLPAGVPVTPFGHSQGGQVIYSAVRNWVANPGAPDTPDPSQVSWVSIGNPENAFGGTKKQDGLPPNTPYHGIEVIKQYDGWADAPDGPFNLLSWLNAQVGKSTTHVFGYFDVDLNLPDNILYTPQISPGVPGNITYVFVPNDTLPLIAMTGILAPLLNPILDPILRPIVEAGYNRPIGPVPAPAQSSGAAVVSVAANRRVPALSAAAPTPTAPAAALDDVVADPAPEVKVLDNGDADQNAEQNQSHHRRAPDRGRPERLSVNPVRNQVGAASRAAAGQRVHRVENLRRTDDSGH
jgi:hypothetical protein